MSRLRRLGQVADLPYRLPALSGLHTACDEAHVTGELKSGHAAAAHGGRMRLPSRQLGVPVLVEGDVGVVVVEADADGFVDGDADEGLAREGALAGLPLLQAALAMGEGGVG